jgi:vitamin-K-epoxide reductase (warfarin-sensitive)
MILFVLATIGFVLALYAFYVENQLREEKHYVPACDIKSNMSCSKAFTSLYGRLGLVPNSLYGMFFYGLIFVLALGGYSTMIIVLALLATLGTIYLAYVSFVKMKNYCLVCCGIYVVNILLLLCSMYLLFFT